MKQITWWLEQIADRVSPLFALCGLLFSIGFLGSASDAQHLFWGLCALAASCVAMWAFWSKK